jgi:type I restriction enzyme S subunit
MSNEILTGWDEKRLEYLVVIQGGVAAPNDDVGDGEIPFIRMKDFGYYHLTTNLRRTEGYLKKQFIEKQKIPLTKKGSIIIPRSGSVHLNHRAILGQDAVIVSHICALIPKDNVSDLFLYYVLCEYDMTCIMTQTTGLNMIKFSDLKNLRFKIPKAFTEQEKIAKVLQSVDNAIDKTKELIEKHKKMKQGLTQSLFDAKHLIGTEQKLSECCIFIRDGTHGSYEDSENGIPLLSAKDVVYGKVIRDNNPRRISLRDYYSIHSKYELQEGDVVLTIVGTIGRSAVLRKLTEKFTFQRSVAILRPKKGVNPSYLYHYTNTFEFQKNLEMVVNASAQGGVYLGALNKMYIVVPDEPKSQTEIVSILDSIDEKIDAERSYLDKLAKIKSGLMQDLLTGKVRVAA